MNLTYVNGTSCTGLMLAHWWADTIDAGDHLILRTKQGAEQARLTVTNVADIMSSYNRTFTFTVDSGTVPTELTDF